MALRCLSAGAACAVALAATAAHGESLEPYLMDEAREIALARSAAPEAVSAEASVWVLRADGYAKVADGANGFNCLVLRRWSSPLGGRAYEDHDVRAPICYDVNASEADMQEQFFRVERALAGDDPAAMRDAVDDAYGTGRLRPPQRVGFAYMMSGGQNLGNGFGAWKPHFMIYAPYYTADTIGRNALDSGLPTMFVGSGGPRATLIIPLAPGETGQHILPMIDDDE